MSFDHLISTGKSPFEWSQKFLHEVMFSELPFAMQIRLFSEALRDAGQSFNESTRHRGRGESFGEMSTICIQHIECHVVSSTEPSHGL